MRFASLVGTSILVLGVAAALPAKGSELTGVYEVHRICTVRPADKKTTGSKDKLFAKIQEGEILVRDDPRLIDAEKRLFAQILDQKGGKVVYEGLLDIELAATPDNRAFNEFEGSLVACSAVRKHQPLDYLELIEFKGVTGGNLVSWAVPSWVLVGSEGGTELQVHLLRDQGAGDPGQVPEGCAPLSRAADHPHA